ncbi:MAG: ComEA family DNA-binding protein [Bacteroidia bacterium]
MGITDNVYWHSGVLFVQPFKKNKIKNLINNYFGFNKQQRRGLLLLCSACLVLLIARLSLPFFVGKSNIVIANLPLIERKIEAVTYPSKHDFTKPVKQKLFAFDPNTVTLHQLLELGLKEKTVSIFLKFRNKGFVFKQKEDLKKVYGVNDELYKKLEPYILIEKEPQPVANKKPQQLQKKIIELNGADSLALLEISGIGPSFAKRIMKYRTLLGGFINVNQLLEVYGFTEEIFEKIKSQVSVNTSDITKLNLNKDDFKTVNKHPYLSYELTKQIFDKRRKEIITPENLKAIMKDDAQYFKLLPYLSF